MSSLPVGEGGGVGVMAESPPHHDSTTFYS